MRFLHLVLAIENTPVSLLCSAQLTNGAQMEHATIYVNAWALIATYAENLSSVPNNGLARLSASLVRLPIPLLEA